MSEYEPPEIWSFEPSGEGIFSHNRPTAGATHERELPVGEHPLQLHSLATPNGVKVALMLEELLEAGHDAEYDAWTVDIGSGEQFGSGFVALNPNSKIPALLDRRFDPPRRVFESGSILLHLAETFGAFLPEGGGRTEALNWLFWQMGAGPFLGGGFGHFYHYAPVKLQYAIDRYTLETKRQLDVLDQHLAEHEYLADEYSIADMANWPWYGVLVTDGLYGAKTFLSVHEYDHVIRWAQAIAARPAAGRALRLNRAWGDEATQVRERHSAADFERD